jgi:hypothetical protein
MRRMSRLGKKAICTVLHRGNELIGIVAVACEDAEDAHMNVIVGIDARRNFEHTEQVSHADYSTIAPKCALGSHQIRLVNDRDLGDIVI